MNHNSFYIRSISNIKYILTFVLLIPVCLHAQPANLNVEIIDASTGRHTPVRVHLVDSDGNATPLPDAAIGVMYGRDDRAEGYAFQPDSAFYVDGSFETELKPGNYHMTISKGFEFLEQQHEITLISGEIFSKTITLERWINMPGRGWYSADDHIHIRRSPRENQYLHKWIAAEDVHVGALLQMGDFWTTYFVQYAWGEEGVYQVDHHMLTSGQEDPRTHEIGHTIFLAADDQVRDARNYYYYDSVFDHVHELGGYTGYAHQGMSFHGYRGMTLDVLQQKVDFLELLQFCVGGGPLLYDHYYHFLDLGFKLTATAGSDFPWCGYGSGWNAQIGNARFYTYIEDDFNFDGWKAGLGAGHTFVSTGPMLDFRVNGNMPGASVDVKPGTLISISATAFGHENQVPLENLEIVVHGEVIASVNAKNPGQSAARLAIEMEMPIEHGLWIAVRCKAGDLQVAHTTPVYITVNGDGFLNPLTAPHYLDLSEEYLQEIEKEIEHPNNRSDLNAWRYKEGLESRIASVRAVIEEIREGMK
jgi:hypothetical protein